MAEAFVRTIERDYVRVSARPNAATATTVAAFPGRFRHYNTVHPHRALG